MDEGRKQTSCKQCGICCTKGGAALHGADMSLLQKGLIPRSDLITIRKGEFAHNPISNTIQATESEIVKLRGTGKEWTCCYYDATVKGCRIYGNRPLACSTLQCWNPAASLELVGKDLLSRLDILAEEDSLRAVVQEYESSCLLPDFTTLAHDIETQATETLADLEVVVNRDLEFRNYAVAHSNTVLQEEMFFFGRPLFQLLLDFGLAVFQTGTRLEVRVKNI